MGVQETAQAPDALRRDADLPHMLMRKTKEETSLLFPMAPRRSGDHLVPIVETNLKSESLQECLSRGCFSAQGVS